MSGWEIKGLFYQCTARTNEEYKVELKKRQRLMIILLLLCSFITVEAVTVLSLLVAIFFLSYIISRKAYSQRM